MIDSENKRCEQFVRDNPELVLPVNLDVCNINVLGNVCSQVVVDKMVKDDGPLEMGEDASNNFGREIGSEQEDLTSPQYSIKEPNSLELWTEVVRRGRPRGKGRSRNEKIVKNERGAFWNIRGLNKSRRSS
jgi:hypothetical protein